MATLRPVLSRWVFAGVVFGVSFIFMGAAFAPFSLSSKIPFDLIRSGSFLREPMAVSGLAEEKSSASHHAVLSRLEELLLTQRALSISV